MVTPEEMVENQLKARNIHDPKVLQAMEEVDRALFVPEDLQHKAYEDRPLPIGRDQTISQPYIVAYMAEQLQLKKTDRVLEVGTGCGYNAAVLSRLARHVFSIEIIAWLADLAVENLQKTGFENITTRYGDGYSGWVEEAPFDAIILTAAPPTIPKPLKDQLKIGGRILAPVGRINQQLLLLHKTGPDSYEEKRLLPVRFVPMTGKADKGGKYGR
ncbi:protein-L-isoaspartate(D-aspartate) O-methyltransferase [Salinimicrobium catena]|uniref:Protein-L-isoaspartate O-methyltransferase n=1 Tax=Salinimicrobium catena TaxID=390640 RepID=A0A1H5MPD4_9FLAO|nr:protein-L-isoaspartate(D-aspartate) O-methyltransferase [Salinimicrobium catena]SDL27149.1 protein-L-isoaspartate(D-aspartate) O-methyltransferase [Salinimicrobium catena]SEE91174.1 protein-L-isoaspartate(D-aspartate) O-methyltransferase [Salinimicrobium catena]